MLSRRILCLVALTITLCFVATDSLAAPLMRGDRGREVLALQQKLSAAGFFEGPATGYFGSITQKSVMAFQRAAKLAVDGIAGQRTLSALNQKGSLIVSNVAFDDRDDSPPQKAEPAPAPAPTPPVEKTPQVDTPRPDGYEVLAYYCQYHEGDMLSYESLKKTAGAVDGIAVFLYSVTKTGDVIGGDATRSVALAREMGIKPLALVNNISGKKFDKNVIHTVLSDPKVRERVVDNILKTLKSNGFAGVNIDFENVPVADRNHLTTFMRLLAGKLKPEGLMVTISVPAKLREDQSNSWSAPFDYWSLGEIADRVMIMTYDQHWSTSTAGPIAGVDWVERMLKFAVATIPSEKIMMGLATYGYDWQIGSRRARAVPGAKAVENSKQSGFLNYWDEVAQVPYYRYKDGKIQRIAYYENAQSAQFKLQLVKKYNLAGIAIWRLGYEDPDLWAMINRTLRTSPAIQ